MAERDGSRSALRVAGRGRCCPISRLWVCSERSRVQADSQARGRWEAGTFELRSTLDAGCLEGFYRTAYRPSPVVSPWNGGSGFFPKDNKEGFDAIEASDDERLTAFREAIDAARAALVRLGIAQKPGNEQTKTALLQELRATLPDDALEWLDAAVVVVGMSPAYPPLLGSGGNDGRFDFADNYARAVAHALVLGGQSGGASKRRDGLGRRCGSGRSVGEEAQPRSLLPRLIAVDVAARRGGIAWQPLGPRARGRRRCSWPRVQPAAMALDRPSLIAPFTVRGERRGLRLSRPGRIRSRRAVAPVVGRIRALPELEYSCVRRARKWSAHRAYRFGLRARGRRARGRTRNRGVRALRRA